MIDARKYLWITLAIFALGIGVGLVAPHVGCTPDEPPVVVVEPVKPDAVVYVYEKDDTAPPSELMVMLDKLNRAGYRATAIDDDVEDGDGQVPDQYKAAIDAARLAGLPAIVLTAKGEFVDYATADDLSKLLEVK